MPHDPLDVVAEILGEPAALMRAPARASYRCPYSGSTCSKTSHTLTSPFPVCSVYRRSGGKPVCVSQALP